MFSIVQSQDFLSKFEIANPKFLPLYNQLLCFQKVVFKKCSGAGRTFHMLITDVFRSYLW